MKLLIRRKAFGVKKFKVIVNNESVTLMNFFGMAVWIDKKGVISNEEI